MIKETGTCIQASVNKFRLGETYLAFLAFKDTRKELGKS